MHLLKTHLNAKVEDAPEHNQIKIMEVSNYVSILIVKINLSPTSTSRI